MWLVGDGNGWTINYDYQTWANGRVFNLGDTLVFNYPVGIHNVNKVNTTDFETCTVSSPSLALTSGHDVVAPGKKWYICSVGRHCADFNQKLVINVQDSFAPVLVPNASAKHGYQVFMAAIVALAIALIKA